MDMTVNESMLEEMVRGALNELLLEVMSPDEVWRKYYPEVDRDIFKAAMESDPTSSRGKVGKYVKWILNLYKNGSWKPDDTHETMDALSKFDRIKSNLRVKDINQYKSVKQLLDAVSGKKSANDIKHTEAEKVYEDGEWLIVVPKTEAAAKLYGKNTTWDQHNKCQHSAHIH